ncbi:MAG: hypothetical protein MJ252_27595, partial [archaeon]|nr:hypothetical protein [archaeon]
MSKGVRKPCKRSLKRYEDKLKALEEAKEPKTNLIQKMKSLGVFVKNYNMSHLLVTRYSVKEGFGIESALKKVENADKEVKAANEAVEKAKSEGKKKENKDDLAKLNETLGQKKDELKAERKNMKLTVGKELLDRFMQGFVAG